MFAPTGGIVNGGEALAGTMSEDHPDVERWWRHRRRGYYAGMAWAALQTIGWIALEWLKPGSVGALGAVIGWSYGVSMTLILAYFGNTTAETWRTGR